jgi:predicted lipid-binding transport protein (Tim44 family)
MSAWRSFGVVLALGLALAGPAVAQDVVVYPAEGQSAEQMDQDKYACYAWARDQTGYDPLSSSSAGTAPAPQSSVGGGVAKGALIGGLSGLAIGAIADDAGKGAAIGAVGGGVIGGLRRSNQNQQAEQAQQQQAAAASAQRDNYNRNYAACLEGRGYSVR